MPEGARTPRAHDVGNARREHARLAGAGAGQHEHGPIDRLDGGALLGVEIGHIGGRGHAERPRRDGALRRGDWGRSWKIGRSLAIRGHQLQL